MSPSTGRSKRAVQSYLASFCAVTAAAFILSVVTASDTSFTVDTDEDPSLASVTAASAIDADTTAPGVIFAVVTASLSNFSVVTDAGMSSSCPTLPVPRIRLLTEPEDKRNNTNAAATAARMNSNTTPHRNNRMLRSVHHG